MFNPPSAPQRGVNEMGAIWDAHFGRDGLSETDRMVLIGADRAADQAEIVRLTGELATANALVEALQTILDCSVVSVRLRAEAGALVLER